MTRLARLSMAGQLHHVIQRGNNRQPVFVSVADRERFLAIVVHYASQFGLTLHAYVLMDNHFHLLVTPASTEALPKTMQAIGRQYGGYFNRIHAHSGSLWEGRYRSTVLQPQRHLLACMAFLDLNPVRAGLVEQANEYPWSSHAHYAGLRHDRWLSVPALVWELGNTPFARESAYRELIQRGLAPEQEAELAESVLHGWVLGDTDFLAALQRDTPRRLRPAARGRPRGQP